MLMITLILSILTFIYIAFVGALFIGLQRLQKSDQHGSPHPLVSVVVAARNEEKNIATLLTSLLNQSYPKELFEIIIVDDNSSDTTAKIVRNYAEKDERVKLISVDEPIGNRSPKKLAISKGIASSKGEIILTTDADCTIPRQWIEIMCSYFKNDVGAVMSWVQEKNSGTMFHKVESLDAFSLVLVGAGGVGIGLPFIANGANFAYRKKVFEEISGFSGIEHFVSGDDDLFLLKMRQQTGWRVAFAREPEACVWTQGPKNFRHFLSQRIRWASKGAIYPWSLKLLELTIYFYYSLLALALPAFFLFSTPLVLFILSLLIKMIVDAIFIYYGSRLIERWINPLIFILTEFFQIFYILFVGIGGSIGKFNWKGRKYTHGKVRKNNLK